MGFEFIAGYTSGGMPYGIRVDDEDEDYINEEFEDDEIPF